MTSARKSGNGEVPDTYFRTELKVSQKMLRFRPRSSGLWIACNSVAVLSIFKTESWVYEGDKWCFHEGKMPWTFISSPSWYWPSGERNNLWMTWNRGLLMQRMSVLLQFHQVTVSSFILSREIKLTFRFYTEREYPCRSRGGSLIWGGERGWAPVSIRLQYKCIALLG